VGSLRLIDNASNWTAGIPNGWQLVQLKHVVTKLNRVPSEDDSVLICTNKGTVIPRDEGNPGLISLTNAGYQGVEPGDLLIHGMDTWHGAIAVSNIRGQCTSVVHVCDSSQDKRFIAYYLRALAFRGVYKAFSNGVRQNTSDFRSWVKAGEIPLILPTIEEQRRIADYLDAKCAEIDTAVESAQASIEELGHYQASMLNQTIDHAARTARPVKLKYLLRESKERSADGIGEPLSITIARGVLKSSELNVPNPTSTLVGAKVVHAGDLVFNKLKARHGVMYVSPYNGLISPEYAIYQAVDGTVVSLHYLEYLCHTAGMIDEFIIRTSGVAEGFRRLYTADLFDITINLPERSAQEAVVNRLDALYGATADSIRAKQSIIDDLKAYKQSLIYEVVTGKQEV
jgi:type I restriction enzyme S subunit